MIELWERKVVLLYMFSVGKSSVQPPLLNYKAMLLYVVECCLAERGKAFPEKDVVWMRDVYRSIFFWTFIPFSINVCSPGVQAAVP